MNTAQLRGFLLRVWAFARQVAAGVDALSRVEHGVDLPPDHPARARSAAR